MNELERLNASRRRDVEAQRDALRDAHRGAARPRWDAYPLVSLHARIANALAAHLGIPGLEPQIEVADREKHGADLVVKVPALLSSKGAKSYVAEDVPRLAEALAASSLSDAIAEVRTKGIYVNLRLTDHWLIHTADFVAELGTQFGHSDIEAARTVVVDYSAPNVAKTLHAGHIRSTIVGHVLANLYEASGALVYRVNHINDFGGFGFILEGWRRFEQVFPEELTHGQRLLELYAIRRTLERHASAGTELTEIPDSDRELLRRYFPALQSAADLAQTYGEFVRASNHRFERLEAGDAEEVALWASMVEWSLSDFREFYDLLDIHIPFTIGESFYVAAGTAVVRDALASGKAVRFTPELARTQIDASEATPQIVAQIEKDVGAVVVPLSRGNRLVVERADGRSIYATRDLGAVALRMALFAPTDVLYVVGQEQRVHFERVFEGARVLGLVTESVTLRHIYFGFYVDAKSGRKLSSRDSVSSVNNLLTASIAHFRAKSAEAGDQTEAELDRAGRELAVGSLVMNDLKQDMKSSVDVAVGDLDATVEGFEHAGGAYVVYAACRARAILRKFGKPVPPVSEIPETELTTQEVGLLLELQEIPARIRKAVQAHDPSVLLRHLVDIAMLYNSYYFHSPVLKDRDVRLHRLAITQAVQIGLVSALALCHMAVPPKI